MNIPCSFLPVRWLRRRAVVVYVLALVLPALGAGAATILTEDFATLTDTTVPSGWTSSLASDLDYTSAPFFGAAAPAYKFRSTGQVLTSPAFAAGATNVQFWAYGNGGAGSAIAVSNLVGSAWSLAGTAAIAQNGATYNVALDSQATQIAFSFTKSVNCAFDDVAVTMVRVRP